MKTYLLKPGVRQAIAKAGETDIAVAYNAKDWIDDYPAGFPQLMVTRPDGVRVPVTVTATDNMIAGQVPNELLVNPGLYSYVFVWVSGETQMESGRCECMVLGSGLAKNWADMRRTPDWAERIFLAASEIEGAIETAMEAKGKAAEAAASAAEAATSAADAAASAAAMHPTYYVAQEFDDHNAYSAGTYVMYSGELYRLTADHEADTDWAETEKEKVKVADEVGDIMKSLIGGQTGQSLRKLSINNLDFEWADTDYSVISKVFNTVNDMVYDSTLKLNDNVRTNGYYTVGDGGGANYVISNSESGGISISLENGLYAVLLHDPGVVNGLQIGLKNDNTTDISVIVNSVTANYAIYLPAGIYNVADTIYLKNPLVGENWTETSSYTASNKPKNIAVLQSSINSINNERSIIYLTDSFANAYIQSLDILCSGYEMGIKIDKMNVRMTHTFVDKVSIRNLKSTGIYLGTNNNESVIAGSTGRSRLIQVGQVTIMGLLNYDTIGIEIHSPDNYIDNAWICTKTGIELYSSVFINYTHIYNGPLATDTNGWWNDTKGIVMHTLSRFTCNYLYTDTCNVNVFVDGFNYSFSVANMFVYGDASPASGSNSAEFLKFGSDDYKDTGMIIIESLEYSQDRTYESSMTPVSAIEYYANHIRLGGINGRLYAPISPNSGGNFNRYPQTKGMALDNYQWAIEQDVESGNVLEIATLRYNPYRQGEALIKVYGIGYSAILHVYRSNTVMTPTMYITVLQTTNDNAYNLTFYYTVDATSKIIKIYAKPDGDRIICNVQIKLITNYFSAISYSNVSYSSKQKRFEFFTAPYNSGTMLSPTTNSIDATLISQLRHIL